MIGAHDPLKVPRVFFWLGVFPNLKLAVSNVVCIAHFPVNQIRFGAGLTGFDTIPFPPSS